MIEATIRDYLLPLVSVPVYIDVPAEPPESYVTIERTGGGEREHIRSAMIAVQCYGPSRAEAAMLHEDVLVSMKALNELVGISACGVNAEYDFTDTETKKYRYQSVYDIIYY